MQTKKKRLCSTHSLKAVHQTSVRPILQFTHHIFEADKILDVNNRLDLETGRRRGRIEVDEVSRPFRHSEVVEECTGKC